LRVEQFEDALDEYGADLAAWPPDLADAANRLLASDAEARDILEDERTISAAFAAPVRAPAGLSNRILEEALAEPQARNRAAPRLSWWQTLGARAHAVAGGMAFRYATVLTICFVGGFAIAQVTAPGQSVPAPSYVSGLYADLAW